MSQSEHHVVEKDSTRRTIFIIIAAVSILLVAGVLYLALQPATSIEDARLENALRPDSPEFAEYRDRLVVEFNADEDALRGERALGDVVITMNPTVRNFTGRTINGLELRAAGYDLAGQQIKERHFILIPARQAELETNKTLKLPLTLNFVKDQEPASLRVELTGVKFK